MIALQFTDQTTGEIVDADGDWAVICETGRLAAQQLDEGRYILGDLALLVHKQYGHDRIADFADESNIDVARVKEYRTLCKYYPKSARADFLSKRPTLTYSHLRDAMRFDDLDLSYAFLDEMAILAKKVEAARLLLQERLGKPVKPPKVLVGTWCRICGTSGRSGVIFEFSDVDALNRLVTLWRSGEGVGLLMTLEEEPEK